MEIDVKLWFNDFNIKDIETKMAHIPRVGDNIFVPFGWIKYNNGSELGIQSLRVESVDWKIDENLKQTVELNVTYGD